MINQTVELVDVVDTPADAADLAHPPLLVRSTTTAVLDAAGLGTGPLRATRIGDGHSNVTFLVEREDWRGVLRRPPRPPYQPKAHDMLREARIQQALASTAVAVPRILHVEQDLGVLGVPFYVMEWHEGVFVAKTLPAVLSAPERRREAGLAFVDQLIQLHLVDHAAAGLDGLGRGEAFAARQLHVFGKLWQSHRTRDLPQLEAAEEWLRRHVPADAGRPTLLHGDFRLANVMFAPDEPVRVRALLDWELSTVGDPIADLGYLLSTYPERPQERGALLSEAAAAATGGFPSRRDLVERYAATTGADLSSLSWWVTLAFWRTAVGLESFYKRAVDGTTDDPFIHALEAGVPELAERAVRAMEGEAL
ncbi:phosphotransferase family protein [Nocardioides sp. NPDC092400]|uniref:phosphotransferase family protein n=1 Tax=Nocardioides sp. NPDC092400 TaxID=3155196 RepID=UPI00343AD019